MDVHRSEIFQFFGPGIIATINFTCVALLCCWFYVAANRAGRLQHNACALQHFIF